jgi:PiT family inorganic phosphate transporter
MASYLISIWFAKCFSEKYLSKDFTVALMIATVWFVYVQMIHYDVITADGKLSV